MAVTYKDAGVDLETAETSTKNIAALAKSTFNENVVQEIGLFGGFYALDKNKYKEPILVSSIDGVGTKLKIAFMLNKHDTVGQDLVNHCVNDIMTSGADPLFFLDYIGTQHLDAEVSTQIVGGMAKACRENGCALIGGETAEMPGFYSKGEYDLAGAIVGVVDRDKVINGENIGAGDELIGLPSVGLHTNGYSLARKVLLEIAKVNLEEFIPELSATWGKTLLTVHRSYLQPIKAVRHLSGLVGISHITGGGIEGNTKRLLKNGLALDVDWDAWETPAAFRLISQLGQISEKEMRQVFNMGVGLVFVTKRDASANIIQVLEKIGEKPLKIGNVVQK